MSTMSIRGTLLSFCVGLPFLCAVFASAKGYTPQPMAAGPKRASLAFDQYMVDLGQAPFTEQVPGRFGFTNRGDTAVTITDFAPSCGCLTPKLAKRTYQPNEFGVIVLNVQSANQASGLKEYTLGVKYNDGQPREAHLVLRVDFPENRIVVRPRALIFYQLGNTAPTTQEIVVRSPQGVNILGARSSSELARVEVGESENDADGNRLFRMQVTVGEVPAGRYNAQVTVFTDDPKHPEVRVPMQIHGQAKSRSIRAVSGERKQLRR